VLPELGDSRQQIGGHVLPRHIIRDQGLGFRVYGLGFKSSVDRTRHWSPSTLVTESRNLCRILPGLRSKREERTPGGAPKTWPWLFLGEWWHEDSEIQRFSDSFQVLWKLANPKFAHCMANPENIQ
jgi:hypothetical protein